MNLMQPGSTCALIQTHRHPAGRRVLTIALWLVCCVTSPMAAADPHRPNIVFILLDDLRWDALGCTGHPFVKTPGIDRIAREGATFRNAFVTTPLCFPSRASFLTGQYARTHGITLAGERAPRSHAMTTFPLLLQRGGYHTAFIGKWHLGNDERPAPGVDRWVSFKEQGEYVDPELNIDGRFEKTKGYLTDLLTDHAVQFVKQPRTKPFMLHLSHKAVHAPFVPAERHKHLFTDTPIIRPASERDDWSGKPVLRRAGVTLNPKDSDVTTTDENIRDQWRCLMAVDEGVTRIFDALEATQQLDRTLIVFSSDNGYFWGEHGLGGKHGPYEESIRVPLLMRYPTLIRPGIATNALALNIDIAPTFLRVAGLPVSADMQGSPLLPIDGHGRTSFMAEFFLGNGTPRFPTWQAVRTDRWKYIRYLGQPEMDELYDLKTDPAEMKNLIHDSAAGATREEMKREFERLLK